jgi:cytochrome c oxidase subunit 3
MSAVPAPQFVSRGQQHDAVRLGMWVFLGTELLLFAPLVAGWAFGRWAMAEAFGIGSRHTDLVLGTVNTAMLLTSSLCMALAVEHRRAGGIAASGRMLIATALLGIAFLAIKSWEWRHDWNEGWFPGHGFAFHEAPQHLRGGVEYFFICYFAGTGLHAIHLLIGLALVLGARWRRQHAASVPIWRLECVGLYWHFIDVIWIFLFPALYLVERGG